MKKLSTLFMLMAVFVVFANAQTENFGIKTEIGPSFTGTSDAFGVTMSEEFLYYPVKNLSLGVNFELQNHFFGITNTIVDYRNLGVNLHYSVNLYNDIVFLNFTAGTFGRQTATSWGYYAVQDSRQVANFGISKNYSLGYTAGLGLSLKLTERLEFSPFMIYVQNDTHGNITSSIRCGLIYRF